MQKSKIRRLVAGATAAAALLVVADALLLNEPADRGKPAGPAAQTPGPGLTATEVTFTNGGTTLHGSIVRRAGLDPATRHPGVVLVHGSGAGHRAGLTQEAEAFARAGVVTLIYDKRGDYSKFHRDFSALAGDALAGLRVLRSAPGVDQAKVGLWGFSEGGWIAPLAASRSTDVKFLVTVGGSGHDPARTQAWHLGGRMSLGGVAVATADTIAGRGVELATGLGLFAAAGHDPVPVLNRVRQPVLAIWGERDVLVPPRESAEIFTRQLTASPSVTVRILPRAGHGARETRDGYDTPGGPTIAGYPDGRLTSDYVDVMTSWIAAVTGGAAPTSSSDTLPHQSHHSVSLRPVGRPGFALFGLILVTLLSWPATAAVRRMLGRRGAPPGAGPARGLALTGLVTALGSAAYLLLVVAAPGQPAAAVLGQPVSWLLLRLLLVATVVCAVMLVRATMRQRATMARSQPLRAGVLSTGAALLVLYALSIGLLLP